MTRLGKSIREMSLLIYSFLVLPIWWLCYNQRLYINYAPAFKILNSSTSLEFLL